MGEERGRGKGREREMREERKRSRRWVRELGGGEEKRGRGR